MQFIYPYFLFSLIAVSIPVIIHLFQFRKYKKEYFSNVKFLENLLEEKHKQSRIKEILVLIARILTIAALVFAFAQPYIPKNEGSVMGKQHQVSIFVDNSFSMQTVGISGSLLDEAKKAAMQIAMAYKPADQFQLLTQEFSGDQQRWLTRDEFLTQLKTVEPTAFSHRLSGILQRQNDLLSLSNNHYSKDIYVLSDFQKSKTDFPQLKVDSNIQVTLMPLKAQGYANLSIDSLMLDSPVLQMNQSVNLLVTLTNHGSVDLEKIPIKLRINKQVRSVGNVDLAAKETKTMVLPFTIQEKGILQGLVEITDYPVVYDDKMYFTLTVREKIPVLLVFDQQENAPLNKLFKDDEHIDYTVTSSKNIDYTAFSRYQLLIVYGLEQISSGLSRELQQYVQQGGSLVVIPSGQSNLKDYNTCLAGFTSSVFTGWDTTRLQISQMTGEHSLFQYVFVKKPENLQMPNIFKHLIIKGGSRSVGENLLILNNQDVFLREELYGKGKVYLFASPFEDAFTDFHKQPLFVITLYNMALQSNRNNQLYADISAQQVQVDIREKTGEVVKMVSEAGDFEMIPELINQGSGFLVYTHGQLKTPGNYLLLSGKQPLCGLSFNNDRSESKPDQYDDAEIKKNLSEYRLKHFDVFKVQEKSIQAGMVYAREGKNLWKICLIAALCFILAEVLLLRLWK